jgi:protein TonB
MLDGGGRGRKCHVTLTDLDPRHAYVSSLAVARVQDQRLLRRAMAAAFLVHFALLFVPLPSTAPPPPPKAPEPGPVITPTILRPPEIEPARKPEPVRGERRLPLPDPDAPDVMPEPEIGPTDLPVGEDAPRVEFIVPPAEAPPVVGPFKEDTRGLVLPVAHPGRARAEYPPAARRIRLEGTVVLKAIIDKRGHVVSIRVYSEPSFDAGFTDAAIDAVSRWRYEPGRYGGEPVEVEITVVVDFILN